jgi:hypothetical protein
VFWREQAAEMVAATPCSVAEAWYST